MTTPTVTETRRNGTPVAGQRVELARYTLSDGTVRALFGQRVNGIVRVSDHSVATGGRAYLVERELQLDGNDALRALVADYLIVAARLDQVPMAEGVLERYAEHVDDLDPDGGQ